MKIKFTLFVLCFLFTQIISARTWYVTPNGGGFGGSWSDPADFEFAVANSFDYDEIYVLAGEYFANFDIRNKELYIYGGFAGWETSYWDRLDWRNNASTIYSANGYGIFSMHNTRQTIIDGFTLRDSWGEGGGVFAVACSPRLSNLIIQNHYGRGAAIFFEGGMNGLPNIAAEIINVEISSNESNAGEGVISVYWSLVEAYYLTIANNYGDAVSCYYNGQFNMFNSIIFNSGSIIADGSSYANAYNSLVEYFGDMSDIRDNISGVDPEFVDIWSNDFHLNDFSPAIGMANINYLPHRYEYFDFDLDANPRYSIYSGYSDMGAYQNQNAMRKMPMVAQENISETQNLSNDIYPNLLQVGEQFTVIADNDNYDLYIYSITGQVINTVKLNENYNRIPIHTTGTYIVVIKNRNDIIKQSKIIVKP